MMFSNIYKKSRRITESTIITTLIISMVVFSNTIQYANGMDPLVPRIESIQHVSSNANLFVSAEKSSFQNYFAGPQVIEVIVIDSDISRMDEAYGEPVVTVNGKRLRVVQATDGDWYGYFADMKQAQYADATQLSNSGKGLDFGQFCSTSSSSVTGVDFSDTKGISVARHFSGASNGTQSLGSCTATNLGGTINLVGGTLLNHVVRQNKTLNGQAPEGKLGQIAANNIAFSEAWPIIQLFDFSTFPTKVSVQYYKAGGVQQVDLNFDQIPGKMIRAVTNRADFPPGSQVQADLIDPQLNIDPTEEDSWTWGASASNNTLFYQAFDRNGNLDADGTAGMQNIVGNLTTLMFNHNGRLTEDPRPQGVAVAASQSNGIQKLFKDSNGRSRTQSISGLSIPVTVLELQPNVGIFAGYDSAGIADSKMLDNAPRGKSFTAKYNDISYSAVVKLHTATLTMGIPGENTLANVNPVIKQTVVSNQPLTYPIFASFFKIIIIQNLFFY
ncbi:conserved exported protein of unknown function [Nitrosotalea devaniterrae]|uniref:Uncharacterized protein n=1 Tax=Nitrosotalea devaniterrae TaxID=1078905 RepID=A0A128A244_9ARCH|nr:conserved exported protein of unknown function [Candidatus Nitrosotalea devanaterra]